MQSLLRRPVALWFALGVLTCALLLTLRSFELLWPPLAWWTFIVLSLTVGFGHGALDVILLLGQFKPRSKVLAVSAAYLGCVLALGWALSNSVVWALLVLVLMSVWHFGELHRYSLWGRLSVGGASVMWPVLVAHDSMATLLNELLGPSFETLWTTWRLLALAWLFLLVAVTFSWLVKNIVLFQKPNFFHRFFSIFNNTKVMRAAIEIVVVLAAYIALSPLLAFALYFGAYHCLMHVVRVQRAVLVHSSFNKLIYSAFFAMSIIVTALLLVLLWRYLPALEWKKDIINNQVLQWLVVSLAAVTLPHLCLVNYSARWLDR